MSAREGYRWQPRTWRPSLRLQQIMDHLVEGKSTAEIAAAVGISADGVKWHIGQALLETGASGRRELAVWWKETREAEASARVPDVAAELTARGLTWISDVHIA